MAKVQVIRNYEGEVSGVLVDGWRQPGPEVKIAMDAARKAARDVKSAENRLRVSVQQLRAIGCSWTVVGEAIGVGRTAAQKRYGKDGLL